MKRIDLYTIIHSILLLAVCMVTFFLNNRTIYFQDTPFVVVMAQRTLTGIAATLFVLFVYLLGKEISRREDFGWIAALICCTTYRMILFGRIPTADICSHAAMTGAIYFLFCTFKEKQASWFSALCSGILIGTSYLCNNLLTFYLLLFPFLLIFVLAFRPLEWKRWRQLLVLTMIACLVIGIRYLPLDFWDTNTAHFIFDKPCLLWNTNINHSWYYYGSLLWNGGVWSLLFVSSLIATPWIFRSKMQDVHIASILWLLLQWLLITIAPHKDDIYLLALMPAFSYLLTALICYWKDTLQHRPPQQVEKLFTINAYTLSSICFLLPVAGYWMVYKAGYMIFDHYLLLAIYTFVISGFLFVASWKRAPYFVVYGIVVLLLIGEVMM